MDNSAITSGDRRSSLPGILGSGVPAMSEKSLRCAELARTRAIPQRPSLSNRDHPHVYRDYILSEPIEVRNQQSQYCRKLNNGDREPILLEAPAENIEVEGLVRLHKST